MSGDSPSIFIEPLASHHDRAAFSCGVEALDRYLRHQASQDVRKRVAAAFALVEADRPAVLGFYTLSATSVRLSDLPESTAKKGASQICESFLGGGTFLSATGRVGGGGGGLEAGAAGWKTRAVSLRAKRSNLGSRGKGDCFASLAMTQRGHSAPSLLRKTEMRPAKKLPKYPLVPAILLGRLAVDRSRRGKGYGELLLMDALKRCLGAKDIGWMALIVDAKDEEAVAFYERYHFIRFSPTSNRLFLPRATIASLAPRR